MGRSGPRAPGASWLPWGSPSGEGNGAAPALSRESFLRDLQVHLRSLYNFARWLTHDNDDAEDIVHDALSKVLSKETIEIAGGEIRTYLFTLIRRTFINRLRRGRYEVTSANYPENEEALGPPPAPKTFGDLPPELIRRDLNDALARLAEDSRAVVVLADMEGFSIEEVSRIMAIPVGTVKSKLWRAHQALQRELQCYLEG